MTNLISDDAIALIVATEVGDIDVPTLAASRKQYDRQYHRPEWPQGNSGITIGIGYDVGAGVKNRQQLWDDWSGKIPDSMITLLERGIGVTGSRAHDIMLQIRSHVDVPWDAAMDVFLNVDVPRWYNICKKYLPNFELLSPDSKGALVSLAYNRGPSFNDTGDRYREMRAIKQHMIDKKFDLIPDEFRRMKRLWPSTSGLRKRRDKEAAFFARGLNQIVMPITVSPPIPVPEPPKPAPKPAPVVQPKPVETGGNWLTRLLNTLGWRV